MWFLLQKKKEYVCFPHVFNYSISLSLTLLFVLIWKCRRLDIVPCLDQSTFHKMGNNLNHNFVKRKSGDNTFMHMPFDAIIFHLPFVTLWLGLQNSLEDYVEDKLSDWAGDIFETEIWDWDVFFTTVSCLKTSLGPLA